ncbi:MAG: toll/interleukin-1 receptor domain-containing protein, partial [Bacteroidota bacterium]
MGLVPGYKYDIFISYVHADNESEVGDGDGWVDQFYKYLDTKLNKHSKQINIWWDSKKLDGSQVFDTTIEEAIKDSAIILCLNSRLYSQSEYCKKELAYFHEKASAEEVGLLIGDRSRIVNVLLSNIHYDEWLPEFVGTSGFVFHDEGAYGDPLPVEAKAPFSDQMKTLRNALVKLMEDFSGDLQTTTPVKEEFAIYFGDTNDSLVDRQDGIISELEHQGFRVERAASNAPSADAHSETTRETIEQAQLAVHLLGEFPGRKIPNSEERFIQQQVSIGMELSTPQLIWMATNMDLSTIENEDYRSFLESLEDGSGNYQGVELVRSNEAELTQLILDHIDRLKQENTIKEVESDGTLKVLLDTHTDDFQYAFDLKKNLTNNDVRLIFNPEDGDPQENIEILYENISEAQKYIFLFGKEENNEWVDVRVKNTMKKLVEFDRYGQDIFLYLS